MSKVAYIYSAELQGNLWKLLLMQELREDLEDKNDAEWPRKVVIRRGEIPGSRWNMQAIF